MPTFRKLNLAEIAPHDHRPLGVRAQVAQEYDAHIADLTAGDYGRAELAAGEERKMVRSRLQAAAKRRGLLLRFRPGPSLALIFHVEAPSASVARPVPAPAAAVTRPAPTPAAAGTEQQSGGTARHEAPPRPPRRRQTAAERYHTMLPRWMRDGQHADQRGGSKRRTR